MSKGDLVTAIAEGAGLTKKSASDALEATLAAISGELAGGGQVTVTGFGTFKVSHRAARVGVNPQNPTQKIQIKASKVPTFKAGKNLKEAVNK
ncbi:HU family DNA-binding protein [Candidatus Gracilibacteria bacterium]|nr:HU family DNA-binding protein [Candidatus Gracilibacteria bacterium]